MKKSMENSHLNYEWKAFKMDEILKNKLKSQKIRKNFHKKYVASLNWSWTYLLGLEILK
jgi:hypothetical protein